MNKEELLQEIGDIFSRLDKVASDLSSDDMAKAVAWQDDETEGWTVGQCLVHIAAWKRNAAKIAEKQIEGDKPVDDYPTAVLGLNRDGFNAQLLVKWNVKARRETLDEHRFAHELLLGLLEALPEDRLLVEEADGDVRARRWLKPALSHSTNHLEEQILPVVGS